MNVDVCVSPWQHVNGISGWPMEAHRARSAPTPGFCRLGALCCWWVGSAKLRPGVTAPPHVKWDERILLSAVGASGRSDPSSCHEDIWTQVRVRAPEDHSGVTENLRTEPGSTIITHCCCLISFAENYENHKVQGHTRPSTLALVYALHASICH